MRRIVRIDLAQTTQKALDERQVKADMLRESGTLDVEAEWKNARKTIPVKAALKALKTMAGKRERCMYCSDSHGADIEHFWPKTPYPERMFRWVNFLLCCTECGRFKGERFPLVNGIAMLVDPSVDDPWKYLDFDPDIGVITARFDTASGHWSPMGEKTVEVLRLDRREALSAGYRKTWRRLRARIETAMREAAPDAAALAAALLEGDDHGLLGWCFTGTGERVEPVRAFRELHPSVWERCRRAFVENSGHL